ncbi:MAG: histidine kinase [Anaerolineae bacterium]|nr:histidine kinase [Anaerolineae bacterium]MCX8068084.1 histidine kinase [Anaerolineae bacterium]
MNRDARIQELKQRIADLRARLPKHTPPPSMLQELEDLEEELARVTREAEEAKDETGGA